MGDSKKNEKMGEITITEDSPKKDEELSGGINSSSSSSSSSSPSSSSSSSSSTERKNKIVVFAEWSDKRTILINFFNPEGCDGMAEGLYSIIGPQSGGTIMSGGFYYRTSSECPLDSYFNPINISEEIQRWEKKGMMPPFELIFHDIRTTTKVDTSRWRTSLFITSINPRRVRSPLEGKPSPFKGNDWDRVADRAEKELCKMRAGYDPMMGSHHNTCKVFWIGFEYY